MSSTMIFTGAVGGIVGGLLFLLAGLALSLIADFEAVDFHGADVASICGAFVFLTVGAHSFDLIDKRRRDGKIRYYAKNGWTVERDKRIDYQRKENEERQRYL